MSRVAEAYFEPALSPLLARHIVGIMVGRPGLVTYKHIMKHALWLLLRTDGGHEASITYWIDNGVIEITMGKMTYYMIPGYMDRLTMSKLWRAWKLKDWDIGMKITLPPSTVVPEKAAVLFYAETYDPEIGLAEFDMLSPTYHMYSLFIVTRSNTFTDNLYNRRYYVITRRQAEIIKEETPVKKYPEIPDILFNSTFPNTARILARLGASSPTDLADIKISEREAVELEEIIRENRRCGEDPFLMAYLKQFRPT